MKGHTVNRQSAFGVRAFFLLLCAVVCLAVAWPVPARAEGQELVKNGSFRQDKTGWQKSSWVAGGSEVEAHDEVLTIVSKQANDARLKQKIHLTANAVYRVVAKVQVEQIEQEGSAGAWIGFDFTSAKIAISNEEEGWQDIHFLVRAPAQGGEVTLCLALGDYGNLASGKASFSAISMTPAEAAESDFVFSLEPLQSSADNTPTATDESVILSQTLSKLLFSALCFVLVWVIYAWAKRCRWVLPGAIERMMVLCILVLAFGLRLLITMLSDGYPIDTSTFAAWASRMMDTGPAGFYSPEFFCDYPPGMLYLLWFSGSLCRLLGIEVLQSGVGLAVLFLPVLLCDMGLVTLIWRYTREKLGNVMGLGMLLILAVHPVLLYDTALWHQVDAVLGLCLAGTFILLDKDKKIAAALVYGLAILMKPQALMLGPVFALPYLRAMLRSKTPWRGLRETLLGMVAAVGILVLLSAPFTGKQPFWPFGEGRIGLEGASLLERLKEGNWLFAKYFTTATSYPYATVNANNVFMLFNGNFRAETDMLGPLTYQQWGYIGLAGVIIAAVVFYFAAARKKIDASFLLAAFLTAGIFMFGPRMHERYLFPVIVFLPLAYAKTRDSSLMKLFALFGAGVYANMAMALLALNDMSVYYNTYAKWGNIVISLYLLVCFVYLAIICFDICVAGYVQTDLMPVEELPGGADLPPTAQEDLPKSAPEQKTHRLCAATTDAAKQRKWRLLGRQKKKSAAPTVRILQTRFRPRALGLKWSAFDSVFVVGLTLIYAIIAFFRLGTTNVPETYWRGQDGQVVEIGFDKEVHIEQIWSYGGISDGELDILTLGGGELWDAIPVVQGELPEGLALVEDDGAIEVEGLEVDDEQAVDEIDIPLPAEEWTSSAVVPVSNDVMYRWSVTDCNISTRTLKLECVGDVWLEELIFVNEQGEVLAPATIDRVDTPSHDAQSDLSHLFDESQTKPDRPDVLNGMYFDELYHGRTAYEHLHGLQPYENTHPPLGKVFIMLGISLFGMNPFGWRCVGTLFGVLMVPIFYLFGKRLLKNSYAALFVTTLFTFDFMHFVQTRIATIDVYGVFFILLMYYFMYEYWQMNFYRDGLSKTLRPLALSGLFFGIGAASKWICIYAGGGLALIFFFSLGKRFSEYMLARSALKRGERGAQRMVDKTAPFFRNLWITLAICVLMFIVVPVAIYIASYTPYFLVKEHPYSLSGVGEVQQNMFRYHSELTARHPYESDWWTWPLAIRPIFYFQAQRLPSGLGGVISSFGNPLVWWVGLLCVVALIVRAARMKKLDHTTTFLLFGLAAQFLPWALITRATFIYHYFASVPFIILATGYLFKVWEGRWSKAKALSAVLMGAVVILFFVYYPALSGLVVSRSYLDALKWLPSWTW